MRFAGMGRDRYSFLVDQKAYREKYEEVEKDDGMYVNTEPLVALRPKDRKVTQNGTMVARYGIFIVLDRNPPSE